MPFQEALPPVKLDHEHFQPQKSSKRCSKGVSSTSHDNQLPAQLDLLCIQPSTNNQICISQVNNPIPHPSSSKTDAVCVLESLNKNVESSTLNGPSKALDLPIPLSVHGPIELVRTMPSDVQGINIAVDLDDGPCPLAHSNIFMPAVNTPVELQLISQGLNCRASSWVQVSLEKSVSSSNEDTSLDFSNDFSSDRSLSLAKVFLVSSKGGKNGSKSFNKLRKKGIKNLYRKSKADFITLSQDMSDNSNHSDHYIEAEDTWNLSKKLGLVSQCSDRILFVKLSKIQSSSVLK